MATGSKASFDITRLLKEFDPGKVVAEFSNTLKPQHRPGFARHQSEEEPGKLPDAGVSGPGVSSGTSCSANAECVVSFIDVCEIVAGAIPVYSPPDPLRQA
jgi:hypothetical protein